MAKYEERQPCVSCGALEATAGSNSSAVAAEAWPASEVEPRVRVAPSKIEGLGVVATENLAEGTALEFGTENEQELDVGDPGWDAPDMTLWEGKIVGNPEATDTWGCFLNHADAPNATIDDDTLVLLRAVTAGEELTIDYHDWVHPEDPVYREVFGRPAPTTQKQD